MRAYVDVVADHHELRRLVQHEQRLRFAGRTPAGDEYVFWAAMYGGRIAVLVVPVALYWARLWRRLAPGGVLYTLWVSDTVRSVS